MKKRGKNHNIVNMIRRGDDDAVLERNDLVVTRFPETTRHLSSTHHPSRLSLPVELIELPLHNLEPLEDYLARQYLTLSQKEGARGYAAVLLDAIPGPDGTTRRGFEHIPSYVLDEIAYGAIDLEANSFGGIDAGYNLDND